MGRPTPGTHAPTTTAGFPGPHLTREQSDIPPGTWYGEAPLSRSPRPLAKVGISWYRLVVDGPTKTCSDACSDKKEKRVDHTESWGNLLRGTTGKKIPTEQQVQMGCSGQPPPCADTATGNTCKSLEKLKYSAEKSNKEKNCKTACQKEAKENGAKFKKQCENDAVKLICEKTCDVCEAASESTFKESCMKLGGTEREVKVKKNKGPEPTKGWCHCVAEE